MKVLDKQLQEALDYAVMKIVQQGGRSYEEDSPANGCMYSDGKGRHCAVGWLLDRSKPHLMQFQGSVSTLCYTYPDEVPYFIRENLGLFNNFQGFHDNTGVFARDREIKRLETVYGVDTSKSHWKQWVDMGDD